MRIGINGMLLGPEATGVEVAILELVRALAERGKHEYTLYAPSGFSGLQESASLRVRRGFASGAVRSLRIAEEQFFLPRRLVADGIELLHAPAYVAPLRSGLPLVLTIYDLQTLLAPETCRLSNRLHYNLMISRSVAAAARIIVPSKKVKRQVGELFGSAVDRTEVIPLGVCPVFSPGEPGAARARVQSRLKFSGPYILFLGNLEPKKNLSLLLSAYARLLRETGLPHRLVLAGRVGHGSVGLGSQGGQLGITDRVSYTGYVDADLLPDLYRGASLFVYPSLHEGFGLAPLEAMACGVPVVASDRGALPEVLGEAARLCRGEIDEDFTSAMSELLAEGELRDGHIARGLALAARHTWEATAAATEAAYLKALNEPSPGG
ncbi:MAG: glycosyltransferase family 4 protein [Planctomycetes bacterium]|nr:glycosyltransferase family 4 protein [Planctomycetota bacterium]